MAPASTGFSSRATVHNIHSWTRGMCCHSSKTHWRKALGTLIWLCSCQQHPSIQDFIHSPQQTTQMCQQTSIRFHATAISIIFIHSLNTGVIISAYFNVHSSLPFLSVCLSLSSPFSDSSSILIFFYFQNMALVLSSLKERTTFLPSQFILVHRFI